MPNFKVKIEGLDNLKRLAKTDIAVQKIIPDVTSSILLFHNTLENIIESNFNAPDNLSSVMIGRSVAPDSISNTLLRYSLQYQEKAIPLHEYPFTVTKHSAISSAPLIKKGGFVKWTKGQWSKEVKSSISKKGKSKIAKRGKNYRYKGYYTGSQIRARLQKKTWEQYPTKGFEGVRAPTKMLFGPSLASLAEQTFNTPEAQRAIDKMETQIIKAFVKAYR